MVLPYNPNIPAADNSPSSDQPKMQENTNSISTIMSIDHYTFADTPSGQHKQVTFPSNVSVSAPSTTEGILYTGLDGLGNAQLYFRNFNKIFQMTGSSLAETGWCRTCGILFQWGRISIPGISGTANFPVTFSAVYNVQATCRAAGQFYASCQAPGLSSVVINIGPTGNQDAYWFAIGV